MATPNIYGQLPPEIMHGQADAERVQKIADAMLAQGMSPMGAGRMVGNTFVAPHWMEGIAKLGQVYAGNLGADAASKDRRAVGDRYNKMYADEVERIRRVRDGSTPRAQQMSPEDVAMAADQGDNPAPMMQDVKPGSRQDVTAAYMASQLPQFQQVGLSRTGAEFAQELKDENQVLNPGASLVKNRELVLTAPQRDAKPQNQSNLARLMEERDKLLQSGVPPTDPRIKAYDNNIRKESEVAKQIVPQVIGGGTPYSIPVYTPQGVLAFDTRTKTLSKPTMNGAPVVRSQDDPELQGKIAASRTSGQEGAKINAAQYEAATSAATNIQNIDSLIKHIDSSQAITGLGAEVFKNVERAKALFGNEVASGKVKDTEILDIMMGSEVFPMIKSLGIGARGMDTPAEREFMRKVLTGEISLNKDTLRQMAKIRKDIAIRTIDRYNKRVDAGEFNNYFSANGIKGGRINYDGMQLKFDAQGNQIP